MDFVHWLRDKGNEEIANGDFVTLYRFESEFNISEQIHTFSGIRMTITRPKDANNATYYFESPEDSGYADEEACYD